MKKILFSLFLIFVLSFSLASAITVNLVWDDAGVYSTNPIDLEQGETTQYTVDAFTTAGPNNGHDHLIAVDLYLFNADNLNQEIATLHQSDSMYSYDITLTLETSSLTIGDYVIGVIATDYNDTYTTGGYRQDTKMLNFTVLEAVIPNEIPIMEEVVIYPAVPNINSDLSGACRATDADSDDLMFQYQWIQVIPITSVEETSYFTQNTLVTVNGLDFTQTSVDDIWELTCRAFDGVDYSEWMSAYVTILDVPPSNNPPITLDAFILPTNPVDADPLNGSCSAFDADSDNVAFNWIWFRNGVQVTSGQSQYFSDLSGYNYITTFNPDYTSVGDKFVFSCQAYDGQDTGAWVNSSIALVTGDISTNDAPVNLSVITPAIVNVSDDIMGTCVADDINNDMLTYSFNWYMDGTLLYGSNSPALPSGISFSTTLPTSYTVVGTVTFSCSVSDGDFVVGPVNSTTLVVDPGCLTNPIADIVGPSSVLVGSSSTFDASNSLASDCGFIVSYDWNITCDYGSTLISTSIPYVDYLFSDVGVCSVEVIVTDNSNLSDSDSMQINVINSSNNTAPVNLSVFVPVELSTSLDLVGTCVADDPENNDLSYDIQWYRNGAFVTGMNSIWMNSGVPFTSTILSSMTVVGDVWNFTCSVTDGEFVVGPVSDTTLIVDNCLVNPIADIVGPSSVLVGSSSTFDASNSLASDCGFIVSYDWNITCASHSILVSTLVPTIDYSFASVGVCSVEVIVTDNSNLSDSDSMQITVYDPTSGNKPVAKISSPETVCIDEEFVVYGLGSIAPKGEDIIAYYWSVMDESGMILDSYSGEIWYVEFSDVGEYTFTLTVIDSTGDQDSETAIVVATDICSSDDDDDSFGIKDNLHISSIDLWGFDTERVSAGDLLFVYVTVENNFDEKINDVQVTFLLPELGRFKSSAVSLVSGDSKTFTILVDIPYYFEEGAYYPKISVVADDVQKRAKISYFEVINQ